MHMEDPVNIQVFRDYQLLGSENVKLSHQEFGKKLGVLK